MCVRYSRLGRIAVNSTRRMKMPHNKKKLACSRSRLTDPATDIKGLLENSEFVRLWHLTLIHSKIKISPRVVALRIQTESLVLKQEGRANWHPPRPATQRLNDHFETAGKGINEKKYTSCLLTFTTPTVTQKALRRSDVCRAKLSPDNAGYENQECPFQRLKSTPLVQTPWKARSRLYQNHT